jgi:hypothetical protein
MSDQGEIQSSEAPDVDSRLSALADRLRVPLQEQPPPAEQPEPTESDEGAEQDDQINLTATEAQAQTEAEELEEVEYEGKTHKLPREIKEAVLRHADYTRKTQEVSERRRVIEQREQMLHQNLQLAEQLAPAFGQLSMLDQQLNSIQSQLTTQLRVDDPLRYNTLGTDYTLLMNQRGQLVQNIEAHKGRLTQTQQQLGQHDFQERVKDALPKVQAAIKGWGAETAKQVAEYARNTGFGNEELAHIASSAPAVISLWKADQYDRLQAAKLKAQPKVGNLPPVAKPGSRSGAQSEQSVRGKQLRDDWQKGGAKSADALAAVLKHRLRGK